MARRTSTIHAGPLLAAGLLALCGVVVGCGPGSSTAPSPPDLRNPAPSILSVTPSLGSTGGGASVTITGVGLLPGIRVAFGSTTVATFFDPHPDRIFMTTPSHPPGSVDLVVTNVDGQTGLSKDAYTFAPPESFDVNGNWRGASFAGDYDEPFTFTVVNGAVASLTCSTSGLVRLSPPASIIHGEFLFRGEDADISGRILAPNEAKGVINIGRVAEIGPCVGAEWHAARE
jgi:hypothetical protein